jgi:hypothetical protein
MELGAFDEDREILDFSYALTVWSNIKNVHFEFFTNIHGVGNASAFVFGVSWSSFFGTKSASSSLEINNRY